MTDQLEGQVSLFDQDTWFGKMSQEPSPVTVEKTSRPSSKKSSKLSNRNVPICLRLSKRGGGGWSKSGCLYDSMGRWSIAWRVHDAQFWGVPQRRKRIALVADFGGLSAAEVLFVRQGLSGNFEPSGEAVQGTAGYSEASTGESGE